MFSSTNGLGRSLHSKALRFPALFRSKWTGINLLRTRTSIFILFVFAYGYLRVCWSNFAGVKFAFQIHNAARGVFWSYELWLHLKTKCGRFNFARQHSSFWIWNSLWKIHEYLIDEHIENAKWKVFIFHLMFKFVIRVRKKHKKNMP